MVTKDDVCGVTIFAGLGPADCERLARAAADISLVTDEYAAHEGPSARSSRCSRGIEAVKLVDGVERVVGEREPGDIFGEVPIALGTVFPVGFRAAEPSRVMRVEPQDYHAVVAVAPDVGKEVGRLAAHRMTGARGLQGLAAEPPPPRAIVVGIASTAHAPTFAGSSTATRSRSRGSRRPTRTRKSSGVARSRPTDDCPVVRVVDGKTVVRPQLRRVAELLGLGTEPLAAEYDTVIVGAGPAGLAAAVYGASEGLRTIVVEREAPGGQAGTSSRIENYLGFPDGRVRRRAREPRAAAGAPARRGDPRDARDHADRPRRPDMSTSTAATSSARGRSSSRAASSGGGSDRRFERLAGKGISYGAARSDAAGTHGLDIHIVGAGNSAGQAALFFSSHAR